jgi:UDP-N-acetylglucosamine/UDP-N-acetylgalactosamine 4-epimerase
MTKKSTILITGGGGFIGSNLCHHFIAEGHQVICLDNFATGNKDNIKTLFTNPNFKLIEGDICDLETCILACKNVDYVLHQAALGSVPRSINNPIATHQVNTTGFLNMLVAARNNNIKRFVYAASSSTYGDSIALPKIEENIGKPLSPYAVTKLVNELYADIFHKTYGTDYIGLRYFNVFGRRQDPNGGYAAVLPKFVMQLMNYESPVINGDGGFSRDFTYIDNVIQANELALFTENKEAINQVYNVAYGQKATLNEMVHTLIDTLSHYDAKIKDVKIIYGPVRAGDIPHSLASIEKANTLLGYNPHFSLQDGLKEAVKWYWENLKK